MLETTSLEVMFLKAVTDPLVHILDGAASGGRLRNLEWLPPCSYSWVPS